MKKIIPIILILSLLFASLVSAFAFPFPISGKVSLNGVPSAGFGVVVTNLRTSDSITVETNKAGEYHVELTDMKKPCEWCDPYVYGDRIFIKACSGDEMCERTIIVKGGYAKVDFNIVNPGVGLTFRGINITLQEYSIAISYWWFTGFLGLVAYWKRKNLTRGKEMLITFFKRLREGRYK